jgi:hypothetical protein
MSSRDAVNGDRSIWGLEEAQWSSNEFAASPRYKADIGLGWTSTNEASLNKVTVTVIGGGWHIYAASRMRRE